MEEKSIPSLGPFSDEEAIARIEAAEADLNDPTKWITSEEMDRRLYEKSHGQFCYQIEHKYCP